MLSEKKVSLNFNQFFKKIQSFNFNWAFLLEAFNKNENVFVKDLELPLHFIYFNEQYPIFM